MAMKRHGIVVEHWDWSHKANVRNWLVDNFGLGGTGWPDWDKRWGEEYDYGLENLYMDEDVYIWYKLRWGDVNS